MKGHQDRETPYENLPFEAQSNVQVNDLAEMAHKSLSVTPDYCILETSTTIYIDTLVASHSNLRGPIQTVAHLDDQLKYMSKKYQWTKTISNTIDWDLFSFCYSKHQIHKMTNIIKYLHGW